MVSTFFYHAIYIYLSFRISERYVEASYPNVNFCNTTFVSWRFLYWKNRECLLWYELSVSIFSDMSFLSWRILYLLLQYDLCSLWLLASIVLNIRHFMSPGFSCFQNELCMFEGSSIGIINMVFVIWKASFQLWCETFSNEILLIKEIYKLRFQV